MLVFGNLFQNYVEKIKFSWNFRNNYAKTTPGLRDDLYFFIVASYHPSKGANRRPGQSSKEVLRGPTRKN